MFRTLYIIANPIAGSGRVSKLKDSIKKCLDGHNLSFVWVETNHREHAIELAANAVGEGYRHIVAVGGDGTAHEVINGMMFQNHCPTTDLTFSLIPVGTGNDWIKTHKIANDPFKAIERLVIGKSHPHDIGQATYLDKNGEIRQRYFFNVAGMGYDAFVTKASNEDKNFIGGKFFYYWLIVKCLSAYQPIKARVILDNKEIVEDYFYTLNAGICIYNGGGAQFCPQAVHDDGLLAVTLVRKVPKWKVILHTPKIYNGTLNKLDEVSEYSVRSMRIEPLDNTLMPLETDGEYLGTAPMTINIIQRAINVFY